MAEAYVKEGQSKMAATLLEEGITNSTREESYYLSQLRYAHFLSEQYSRSRQLFQQIKELKGSFENQ